MPDYDSRIEEGRDDDDLTEAIEDAIDGAGEVGSFASLAERTLRSALAAEGSKIDALTIAAGEFAKAARLAASLADYLRERAA